jgi:hypothetical protein
MPIRSRPYRHAAKATTAGQEKIKKKIIALPPGIPKTTPEPWLGKRNTDERLPDFFRRVWGKYLRKGLRMSHLKVLDPPLYGSLRGHIVCDQLPWPDDLTVTTQRSQLHDWVRAFNAGQKLKPEQMIAVGRFLARKQAKRLDH